MNRNSFVPFLAVALAVTPAAVLAQAAPHGAQAHPEGSARAYGQTGLIHALTRMQAELGLTTDQVARLEAIAHGLHERNAPLLAQLRASDAWPQREQMRQRMGGMTPEQREQMRQRMGEMTPEQREQMRQRMGDTTPEQREQMRQRMGGAQRGMTFGPRAAPAELQPVLRQIRENSRAALEEARAVLTSEQQEQVRSLARQRVARTDRPVNVRQFRRGR
jgi:hypothetical protein